jgi:hypothetical protein
LKPILGGMFWDYLQDYTHWGWIDVDSIMGDMSKLMEDLRHYDIVSYMDGVRMSLFASVPLISCQAIFTIFLSGQLTVFRNIDYFRRYFYASYLLDGHTESLILITQLYPKGQRLARSITTFILLDPNAGRGTSFTGYGTRFATRQSPCLGITQSRCGYFLTLESN